MSLVYIVSVRFHIPPMLILVLALQYAELYLHKDNILEVYHRGAKRKDINLAIEDFCLDVLAGRIKINRQLLLKEGK